MRLLLLLPLIAGCAPRVHAEAFVKKNFGFAGPRELTLVGPTDDTHALRLELQKQGFEVLEVKSTEDATTRYVAEIAGVCNSPLYRSPDTALHVFVVKRETGERVLSARLEDNSDCPASFFTEAAAAIARHWPAGELAAQ